MASYTKNIFFFICFIMLPMQMFAQSSTDNVLKFERLMREWKSASYNTGSEKYAQLKSMMSEGCKMNERVAKAYIDEYNASTIDIRANAWLQYIKEKRISISLRDLREETGKDGRRIVYCWIKYVQPGKPDREDFVGIKFEGGKIFYICNDDMELANRLKTDSENNVIGTEGRSSVNNTVTTHNPPQKLEGYEPYAVFKYGTLTLYYGNNKPAGAYGMRSTEDNEWGTIKEQIKKVVFDQSFKNYRPKSCYCWFHKCKNLISIEGIRDYLNTSEVTDMSFMFDMDSCLTSLDVSGFNTEKVTDMRAMFQDCGKLTSLDVSHFNTANVTNMAGMFRDCEKLTSLDVSHFNTFKVIAMRSMFNNCHNLTRLDVSGFNTANVTDMSYMFRDCENLTSLDVSHFNTAKVTIMRSMFNNCHNLTRLDVSGFNTANVTDMEGMFRSCKKISYLDVRGFNTTNVTNMRSLFCRCESITSLDVSNFNTSKVTNMEYMFYNCGNLKTIYVGDGWNTSKVTKSDYMFQYSTNLVGGRGTRYDSYNINRAYAHIDGGTSNPGYFTRK